MTKRFAEFALLTLAAACLGGCSPAAHIELTAYKDPYFPESYRVRLSDCAFRVDRTGDYQIVGYASGTLAGESGPAVEQWVELHMFWKPRPGKTYDNPTSVDATVRYVISSPQGVAVYTGTAFVYPKKERFSQNIVVSLESARLKPESHSGETLELLGDSRLKGVLSAKADGNQAIDLARQLELRAAGEPAAARTDESTQQPPKAKPDRKPRQHKRGDNQPA